MQFISLALLAAVAVQAPSQKSFCQRLADPLSLKPSKKDASTWERNTAESLGAQLFGAERVFVMHMESVSDPATVEEMQRLAKACSATRKGAICQVEGPAAFTLQVQDQPVRIVAETGEKAKVEIMGTSVRCQTRSG